jgi:hypothetical protein
MGMLEYGAVAGAAGEYLDQSKETRKNDFTLLRDKRLSELKQGDQTHAAGLITDENKRKEKHGDENYTYGMGDTVVRAGATVATGSHRPNAGSYVDPDDRALQTKSGDYTSWKSLRDDYEAEYTTIDQWGTKTTKPGAPTLNDYRNEILDPRHALVIKKIEEDMPDNIPEEEKEGYISRAFRYWFEDGNGKKPKDGGGGMLTESDDPFEDSSTKMQPLQSPLSQAAKSDPVQMYDELNAQGFGDQDIEDTIRIHFKDPTWTIPANALQ